MGNCASLREKINDSFLKICNSSKKIYIQIIKPQINNDNLLDFENNCVLSEKFSIPLMSFLNKGQQNIHICNVDSEKTLLFKINNRKLCIDYVSEKDDTTSEIDTRCWIVLNDRFFSNYRISLTKGDIIKLGKIVFLIADLDVKGLKKRQTKEISKDSSKKYLEIEKKTMAAQNKKNGNNCKYCLDEETHEDPFVSPCKCSGSVGYVHVRCLQLWAKEKVLIVENDYVSIYSWQNFICDLCKTLIPSVIQKNGEDIQLVKVVKPSYSFIQMETFIESKYYRFYINLDKQDVIKMGRYIDCEIRLNEISVSRHHSKICKENNEIFIEDMGSKYGTLLLYKEPLTMENILMENEELCLQNCGFLMKFSLKENNETASI